VKSLIVLFFCFTLSILSAGTTGKLMGRVFDEKGKPIPYANLLISQTELGTQTNVQGKYRINQIVPGTYSLICSMVGYQSQQINSVKINLDETTVFNFKLEILASKIEGMKIIENSEKFVNRMNTSSRYYVTPELLDNAPVDETIDLLALQPGVYENNGEIYVRGGKPNEVVYFIDGIPINDPLQGGSALTIDKDAIQEIKVMTGGYPAEFGNAQSGVINIITKTGTDRYHGKIEFSSDHLLSRDNMNSDKINLALSGPLIPNLKKRITFFMNGSGNWHDYDNYDFKGDDIFDFDTGNRSFNLRNGNIKLNFEPSLSHRISVSARADENRFFASVDGKVTQNQFVVDFRHIFNPSKSLSVKGSYYSKKISENSAGLVRDDYISQNDEFQLYNLDTYGVNLSGVDITNTIEGTYHLEDFIESYGLKADFDYQYNDIHGFKAGAEFAAYNTERDRIITPWKIDAYRYNDYLERNATAVDTFYTGLAWCPIYTEEDIYKAVLHASGETFGNVGKPFLGSIYMQDKMEWEGLIASVGMRFDLLYLGERYQYLNDYNELEWVDFKDKDKYKFTISPRFGISYAVSTKSVVHFSYNVQSQMPDLKNIYTDTSALDSMTGELKPDEHIVSSPGLDPRITLSTEIGIQKQLWENTYADLTAYMKQSYNYASVTPHETFYDETQFWYEFNSESYGSSKGVELKLQRAGSRFLSAFLSYTLAWSDGTFSRFVNLLDEDEVTLREFSLDWDIRHSVTFNGSFAVDKGMDFYLPATDIRIPFDDFSINVVYNQATGTPFTMGAEEINTHRNNATHNLHLKFQKYFTLYNNMRLKTYLSINNVLDTYSTNELGDLQYDPELYTDYPGSRSEGRQITTGLGLSW